MNMFRSWVFSGMMLILQLAGMQEICAQPQGSAEVKPYTLGECIEYALGHQPALQQSRIGVQITAKDIMISLSGWFPEISADADLQHYFTRPSAFITDPANPSGPKTRTSLGLTNTSDANLSVTQNLFTADLLLASRSAGDLRTLSNENTGNTRINTVVTVSKAFWDVLLSEEQLQVIDEDIQRLERNYEDARHLYENGLTDKIDYQQAFISLNNARGQHKSIEEQGLAKYAFLKETMGYPPDQSLKLSYDSLKLETEIFVDTTTLPDYASRIEYRQLETTLRLMNDRTSYYRWSFLPSLSAFYDYNLVFQNDKFPPLYNMSYPNSLVGLRLSLPLFKGSERWQNLKKAKLEYDQEKLGEESLKSQISSEYQQALGSYKSNLYMLKMARTNTGVAREVYTTVKLQYNAGTKTYLDVIVAESDLKTSRLNYLSALYQVLSSKMDLMKALGKIPSE